MSRVTTLPAPMTSCAPMRTLGRMIAPPYPTQLGMERVHGCVDLHRRAEKKGGCIHTVSPPAPTKSGSKRPRPANIF